MQVSLVLVTGSAGFIGSHVCEGLTAAGWRVRGVDAFTDTYDAAAKRRNISTVSRHPLFEMVTADLLVADLTDLLRDVDVVVHLAAEPGVATSWGPAFRSYVDRNVLGTETLLRAATAAGVAKFVYASSSSVYQPSAGPVRESAPLGPLSPYGVSKLAGECLVGAYAAERGLPTAALRFFSVYGPRQRPDMAAHRFIEALLDGRAVQVFGGRQQLRDFTYIADVAAAVVASVECELPPGAVLNIAHGVPVAVTDVLRILAEEMGVTPQVQRLPHRHGDTPSTHGNAEAARELLGWQAATDIRTGLRHQIEWQVAQRVPEVRLPASPLSDHPLAVLGDSR